MILLMYLLYNPIYNDLYIRQVAVNDVSSDILTMPFSIVLKYDRDIILSTLIALTKIVCKPYFLYASNMAASGPICHITVHILYPYNLICISLQSNLLALDLWISKELVVSKAYAISIIVSLTCETKLNKTMMTMNSAN